MPGRQRPSLPPMLAPAPASSSDGAARPCNAGRPDSAAKNTEVAENSGRQGGSPGAGTACLPEQRARRASTRATT
eukprot:1974942-Alexandrium_andersonii.AAC.1